MSNMSYCRFRNTTQDMRDCIENLDEPCNPEEHRARRRFIRMCFEVAADVGDDDPDEWANSLPVDSE